MYWLLLLPLGLIFMTKPTQVADATLPRGIRNNNPLNIRKSADNWQGKTGDDGAFVTFDTPHNGIRAAGRLLKTYRDRHGLNTIGGIIGRWAPPNENDTVSYIASVEQKTGISRNQRLNDEDYPAVVSAMIYHENGQQPYDAQLIREGVYAGIS